jgi:transcriptional regulator with XRE-family HTH domain
LIHPINPIKREWLKSLRHARKLKTREVAEIFGISFQHYNDIENGRRNPSVSLSMEIAKFFDVSVELFLGERTKFTKSED